MRHSLFYRAPVDQIVPRSMRRDETRYVRQVWWDHARLGHRMPTEKGGILLQFPYKERKAHG